MRSAFINALQREAERNESVILLMAEVGYSVVEGFESAFPRRFYNVGIAEQSLVATAAGMALRGKRPCAYSMASFLPSRAFEQIKVLAGYQNLPILFGGVGTGLSYGPMGGTHHATEDLAVMCAIPNMTVICPADNLQMEALMPQIMQLNGPCYVGVGINSPTPVYTQCPDVKLGRASVLREGTDVAILTTGTIVIEALKAADKLQAQGIEARVVHFHTVKPIDEHAVASALKECGCIVVLDEHTIMGGFSTTVTRVVLESGTLPRHGFKILAIPDQFAQTVDSRAGMLGQYGLCSEGLIKTIASMLAT